LMTYHLKGCTQTPRGKASAWHELAKIKHSLVKLTKSIPGVIFSTSHLSRELIRSRQARYCRFTPKFWSASKGAK
jgi:hypothetical protein